MKNDSMSTCTVPCWYKDITKFVARASLAAVFLVHGLMKQAAWQNPDGSPLMRALFVIETLGAVMVLIGLWTRWAAVALALVMIGATNAKMNQMGVGFVGTGGTGWEFDLVIFALALVLTAIGSGCFSVDALICKMKAKK